ncbi:MAG: TlpA disulfide reductase family protein [Opitutaceae bacterium]|jgi:thiol-disulfide isomerase/thioredoxin
MKSTSALFRPMLAASLAWSACTLLQALPLDPAIERELTSATGEKVAVRIVDITETQVKALRLKDQTTFLFPVERLSAEDRGFVMGLWQVQKQQLRRTAQTASASNQTLPTPRPGFSLALSQLSREKDPEKIHAALEVVIAAWSAQSSQTFPVHYVSYSVWMAVRRLPDQAATETWLNSLLSAKLNDRSLTPEQRDGYVFISLSRNARTLFSAEWREALNQFTHERPDSPLLANLETAYAGFLYRTNPDEARQRLRAFLSSANQSLAAAARERLQEWAELEKLGPINTWRFTAVDGREVDIAKMRGKVVVVDFWATWCGPCVKELPTMQKLYADYHDLGLEIVGIALEYSRPTKEESLAKLRDYVVGKNLPWPHYADGLGWKTRYSAAQGINSIPRIIIIDRQGTVLDERLRGDALVKRIAGLLGDATPSD